LFVIPRVIAVPAFSLRGGAEDVTDWVGMHLPRHFVQLPRDTGHEFDVRRGDIAIPIVMLPTIGAVFASVRIPPTTARDACRNR